MVSSLGDRLLLGRQVKSKMKIKCVKEECPNCKQTGSIQLFMNRDGEVRYARVRHYSHLDKDSKKPQFTYCKVEDLQALKTLLSKQSIPLTTDKGNGSIGQGQSGNIHDPKLQESSPIQENTCGRRLVWFRTLAFQANDPGFKSRRPHQNLLSVG